MQYRFGSPRPLFGLALILFVSLAAAQQEFLERSMRIMNAEPSGEVPNWLSPDRGAQFNSVAAQILEGSRNIQLNNMPEAPGCGTVESSALSAKALVFASWSLPKVTLENYFARSREGDVIVLFRGVGAGESITDFYLRFAEYVPEADEGGPPNVALDPTLFKQFQVTAAPTIIAFRDGRPVARATGDVSVDWVIAQAEEVGDAEPIVDLGVRGAFDEIAERDLIEEMQERVLAIDWDKKKDSAIKRFWQNHPAFVDLPVARETRTWEWSSRFMVPDDILDGEGNVLIPAGHIYNPFEYVPLPKTIIVFDALDEDQLNLVRGIVERLRSETKPFVLITTGVDREKGFKFMEGLEGGFQSPVYILDSNLATGLGLAAIPSIVRGEGARVFITEMDPSEYEPGVTE